MYALYDFYIQVHTWDKTKLIQCNVWFQKPHERSLEIIIPRGRWVSIAKFLEEKYEAKLEFPGVRGYKMKTFCGESMDIF